MAGLNMGGARFSPPCGFRKILEPKWRSARRSMEAKRKVLTEDEIIGVGIEGRAGELGARIILAHNAGAHT